MARRRLGRVGLLLLGTLAGFALTLLVLYVYVQRTRSRVVENRIQIALGLPRDAFELEAIEEDGRLRIALRDVAFLDRAGDTLMAAPRVRTVLDARTLNGTGPVVFPESQILRPDVRLVQRADGEWNVFDIFAVEAGGAPVQTPREAAGKPLDFRSVEILDGRARIATPGTAPGVPGARFASDRGPEVVRQGGRWWTVRYLTDIDATLGRVRVGGAAGWRVEIADATANVSSPDTRIAGLRGWIEDRGDQVIRFAIGEMRTTNSAFEGAGTIATGGAAPVYDVTLRARRLDFRDLQALGFRVPREGTAAFVLGIETLPGGRTRWEVTDANVAVLGSRASGRLTAVTAPGAPVVFSNTLLTFDPLRISDVEALGFKTPPVNGTITGTVASVDQVAEGRGSLRIDVVARLTPEGGGVPESVVRADGVVALTGAGVRLSGVRVQADALQLGLLAAFQAPGAKPNPFLRGVLDGAVTVSGTPSDLRFEGGTLSYLVDGAPATRITGLSGALATGPPLRWSLRGRAEPLSLATLTALFPQLPFRTATLSGPIALSGSGDDVTFDVDLDGAAGALAVRGSLTMGAVPRFDVSGRVEAFRPSALIAGADLPTDGPLTGTFSARGTSENFRFSVDATQGSGTFALSGTVRNPGGTGMQFDVAGNVQDFRIGALLGRPDLLPGPVSGRIAFSGGGRQAYRFDVDLRGADGTFDLEGWYLPGAVPRYAISGAVAGLDLSALPGLSMLPRTRLTGTVDIEGRGTTPETFAGRLAFRAAPGSTVAGIALDAGVVRLEGEGGVLRVETLDFALRGARLQASGTLGLTRPAPGPLSFSLYAPNLAALRPVIPGGDTIPELAGAVSAQGTLTGTIREPTIAATGEGRGLRYGGWGAETLDFDVDLASAEGGWTGRATLDGTGLELAGTQELASLRLETNFTPTRSTFSFAARRDANTDLAAAGTLETDGLAVQGAILDALTLRLGGTEWRLQERARIGWTEPRGLEVENLVLRSADGLAWIEADGALPPTGVASLRVRAAGLRLAQVRTLLPTFPDAQGTLRFDAAIEGPVRDPVLVLDARIDSLAYRGAATEHLALTGRYEDGRMELYAHVAMLGREVLEARGTLPMNVSLGGIVPTIEVLEEGPLTARIVADSLPVSLVAALVPTLEDGEGVARAEVNVGGTLSDPVVAGSATLVDGAFTIIPLGVRWERVAGALSFQDETIRVDSLVARTGDTGVARVTGRIVLEEFPEPFLDLRLESEDFQLADSRDLAEIEADASLVIAGSFPAAEVRGWVRVEDGTIYLPEFGQDVEADILAPDVGELGADTVTAGPSGGAALLAALVPQELRVIVGEGVWLESPDARIQISGELLVDREGGINQIWGDLEAERGTYTLQLGPLSREFEIVSGRVEFRGGPEINPVLDVVAEYGVRGPGAEEDLGVQIRLTGTLQNPQVALGSGSRTPLTQSELASVLLFGSPTATAGTLYGQIVQGALVEELITSVVTRQFEELLVRSGVFDYVRVRARPTTTGFAGLSAAYTSDILSNISLEAGRELVDNVFATLEVANLLSNGNQQLGAALDWEITRSLSLRAAIEPVVRSVYDLTGVNRDRTHQATVELRRRWEYGRPPRREEPIPRPRREPAPGEPSTPTGEPPPQPPDPPPP